MVNRHSKSFFGKSSGLTIQSSSRNEDFIFFKCIKKKNDGSWEKPSNGEGKTIKINLDEIVMILEVLRKNLNIWSGFHNFKDIKTQISFKWATEKKDRLYINIGKYSKMLNYAEIEILRMLLEHILKEKIEYSTCLSFPNQKVNEDQVNSQFIKKRSIKSDEITPIEGTIKGETPKALLINFEDDHKYWIPKSAISSNYDSNVDMSQTFQIATWLLRKNNLLN